MDKHNTLNNLVNENLVIVPTAPPRYTIGDYQFDQRQKNRVSDDQQMTADRILNESTRLMHETRCKTEQCKETSDFRIKERLLDVEFVIGEILKEKKKALLEEDALKMYRQRLLGAIKFLKEMCKHICQKCIILRENRLKIDMVNDEVDRELKHEIRVIENCQQLFERILDETNEQIRRLRASVYQLDRDLSQKEKSHQIDETNIQLRHNQMGMSIYEGRQSFDPYNSTVQEWQQMTMENIVKVSKELNASKPLRSYVDILLKQGIEDCTKQVDRTNESFTKRINETRYAKTVLENIHCQTVEKVNNITRNITELEKELSDKEGYLALVQMRLGNRAQRPGLELCNDNAQQTLLNELNTLRETTTNLNRMLLESKSTLRYLLHTQMVQEEDINIKTNSLKIDEVDCMTIRHSLNFTTF